MTRITFEKTARLSDVAKAAGVSKGTASNVFNRPEVVRKEVRERVLAAARSVGYRGPDPKGRLLSAGKVNAIGVATVEPLAYFFEDPFARVLMTGITEACDASGTGISLVSAASEEDLAWNVTSALVDGFILFCLEGADKLIALSRQRQLPFVALDFGDKDEAIEAVQLAQRLAQHVDRLGARAAKRGCGRDRLLDRVDRRHVGDEEGDVDADEDDQQELGEPFADVGAVSAHRLGPRMWGGRAAAPIARSVVRQFCAILCGRSLVNMYLVFAQFGTGLV